MARAAQQHAARLHQLREAEGPPQTQSIQAAMKAIDDLVQPLLAEPGFTVEHYVEVSSPLLEEYAAAALKVAEAGLTHFPDSRFLFDHVGFAHTRIADESRPGKARMASLSAAEEAFRKGLKLQPDTYHAHLGLSQVLDLGMQPVEALRELAIGAK